MAFLLRNYFVPEVDKKLIQHSSVQSKVGLFAFQSLCCRQFASFSLVLPHFPFFRHIFPPPAVAPASVNRYAPRTTCALVLEDCFYFSIVRLPVSGLVVACWGPRCTAALPWHEVEYGTSRSPCRSSLSEEAGFSTFRPSAEAQCRLRRGEGGIVWLKGWWRWLCWKQFSSVVEVYRLIHGNTGGPCGNGPLPLAARGVCLPVDRVTAAEFCPPSILTWKSKDSSPAPPSSAVFVMRPCSPSDKALRQC
ncbi:hypothetical protein GWK47_004480 [Chionoecetes opilio]|uniref:Uncharacterized protein n=1 Tax=Chionoecetes opilio TaxID=41210 RepID=A0A8J4YDI4_CHIOP|nr:hypothetical protein GWK47_004480 [Chionoecetes opilio]